MLEQTSPDKLKGASTISQRGNGGTLGDSEEAHILQYFAMPKRHSYLLQNMKIQRKRHTTIAQAKSHQKA